MTEATTLALVAILGTVITALFKLLDNNTKALRSLSDTNDKMARESKQRNGHLGELILKQGEMAIHNKEQVIDTVKGLVIDKQTVNHQHVIKENVDKQTVNK